MIALIKKAAAFIAALIASSNAVNAELEKANTTIANQAKTIEELKAQHDADEIDDKTLEEAATAARAAADAAVAKYNALQQELAGINEAGQELALAINQNPDTPIVNAVFHETANVGALDAVPAAPQPPVATPDDVPAVPANEAAPAEEVKPAEPATPAAE